MIWFYIASFFGHFFLLFGAGRLFGRSAFWAMLGILLLADAYMLHAPS